MFLRKNGTASDTTELQKFIDNEAQRNKSPATLLNYRKDLEAFIRWIQRKNYPLMDVGPQTIGQYGSFLTGRPETQAPAPWWSPRRWWPWRTKSPPTEIRLPLAPASRRRHLTSLKMFFRFIIDSQQGRRPKLIKNPVSSIHSIKLKDIDVQHTKRLTRQDFDTLVRTHKGIKEQFILHMLFLVGVRLAELCALKVEDFSEELGTIRLLRKGGSIHHLKIHSAEQIFLLFRKYCYSYHILSGPLFFDLKLRHDPKRASVSERSMYGYIRRLLKKALPSTHQDLGPHSFRKGCATEIYAATKDLLLVRNYLNHKDAKVTQMYIDSI
jgi:integrase/recombinase XerD